MGVSYGGRKGKGSKAERDLAHMFWKEGFAVVRSAGSGSTTNPNPDIIVGNSKKYFAIECKTSSSKILYIPKEEITQLDLFANLFGARAFIAVKFLGQKWYFLKLIDIRRTTKSYAISVQDAKKNGLVFEELIGKYRQKKLT
jgi:Holliday junction resolvase